MTAPQPALNASPIKAADYQPGLVSVLITTFNREKLVQQAIDSVQRQTWKQFEIIVIDDGSTDNTSTVLEGMHGITYIKQHNQGAVAARNAGLKQAKGEFVATLDSDDSWNPEFLEQSISALEKFEVDLVFSNWIQINEDQSLSRSFFETNFEWWNFAESSLEHWRLIEPQKIREILIDACIAPTSAWLFRTAVVKQGWTSYSDITEDWGLLQQIVLSNPKRIACNMQRSWIKRVQSDNMFEGDAAEVSLCWKMHCYAPRHVLQTHAQQLTRTEKAHLHRRLAARLNSLRSLDETTTRDKRICMEILKASILAFAYAPVTFLQKLRSVPSKKALSAPVEDLKAEGLFCDPQLSKQAINS